MKTGTCSACLGEAMDVLFRDQQQWRLRIQSIDDLWVLQRLLRPGFSMAMLGERRDQTTGGDEGGRSKQAERKKMWIQLLVVKAEHQAFADALRVHGTIEEAPVDVGLHHTHVVNLRDEILISSLVGPAIPVTDIAKSASAFDNAPFAIWMATCAETAPRVARSSGSTPNSSIFAWLA